MRARTIAAEFFVALPVYQRGLPHATVAERRRKRPRHRRGHLSDQHDSLAAILKGATLPQNVDLYLYPAQGGAAPAYMRASPLRRTPPKPMSLAELEKAPHWSGTLKVGDASWNARGDADEARPHQLLSRVDCVLVIVVLVFGAVLAYLWAVVRNALRLENGQ